MYRIMLPTVTRVGEEGGLCLYKTYCLFQEWCGNVVVKRLTINPEGRGSIPGLVGNFLRHLVFPTQLEVKWFETRRWPRVYRCFTPGMLKNQGDLSEEELGACIRISLYPILSL